MSKFKACKGFGDLTDVHVVADAEEGHIAIWEPMLPSNRLFDCGSVRIKPDQVLELIGHLAAARRWLELRVKGKIS